MSALRPLAVRAMLQTIADKSLTFEHVSALGGLSGHSSGYPDESWNLDCGTAIILTWRARTAGMLYWTVAAQCRLAYRSLEVGMQVFKAMGGLKCGGGRGPSI